MRDRALARPAVGPRRVAVAAALDLVFVLLFVLAGRRNHEEAVTLAGVWHTLWPFLGGLAVGWLAARAWRRPFHPVRAGMPVWLGTVLVGMVLRVVSGQGIQPSFIIVAAVVLGAFLVGWRMIGWRVIGGGSPVARRRHAGADKGRGRGMRAESIPESEPESDGP